MADNEYILLHNRDEGINISKFMELNYVYGITADELFEFNREFIWSQMTDKDKKIEKAAKGKYPESAADLTIDMWLPSPCYLKIAADKVTAELAISQTNLQVDLIDFCAFADEKIQSIIQNEGYRVDTTTKRNVDCQVFGWFKSLYYAGLDEKGEPLNLRKHYLTEFSDISKYIVSLSTMVTNNGGSFVLRLPVISGRSVGVYMVGQKQDDTFNPTGELGRAAKNEIMYRFGENREEYYAKSLFDDVESNYFNWLITSNDLIFISFEKLEMEQRRDANAWGDEDNFDINTAISENVFDMIALVDNVKVVTNAQTAEAYVEVTGRDLMKLLIEDGSFFFNPSVTSDPSSVFANESSWGKQGDVKEADMMSGVYNNPIGRVRRISGEIDVFANRINMSIDYIIKGVLSQLANVEIVPDYVFDSWGDDRTEYIELQPKEEKNGSL